MILKPLEKGSLLSLLLLHIFLLFPFFFPDLPRVLLLSFEELPWNIRLLVICILSFPLPAYVFIAPSFLKGNFIRNILWLTVLCFQHLKNFLLLSSDLCGFRWKVCCHSNWCSPIGNASFLCGCFQDYFLCLCFQMRNDDMSRCNFLTYRIKQVYLFVVYSLEPVSLCLSPHLEILSHFFEYSSALPSFSFLYGTLLMWSWIFCYLLSHRSLRLC